MRYVDGFVLPILRKKLPAYRRIARKAGLRGETVVFSWIVFKSRAHRDRVNARAMKDPRMQKMMDPAQKIMDPRRMVYGGFDVLVDLRRSA